MILYPAIDLKEGKCVRLYKGEMNQATVYNDSPAAQARSFMEAGCEWLHVVDLNGAFAGAAVNREAVNAIVAEVGSKMKIELGGGIRDLASIAAWLEAGIGRVIIGTAALKNPGLVISAAREFPNRIAVGIDARGGKVAIEGWAETSEITAIELAKKFEDAGVAAIIHTDVDRDGTLQGPSLDQTLELAQSVSIPIIVSGGIGTMDDLIKCKTEAAKFPTANIDGVIVGRAIYEGKVDPKAAAALLKGDN